jgi:DNA polymerase-3 subunit epsilon
VNPQRSSHPDARAVHGLTDEFLADKPLFAAWPTSCWPSCAGAEW